MYDVHPNAESPVKIEGGQFRNLKHKRGFSSAEVRLSYPTRQKGSEDGIRSLRRVEENLPAGHTRF
jgi:hypothetical protein